MATLGESPAFVNPYEVRRPYASGIIELLLGRERLLIRDEFIVGFGHAGDGVVVFVTADETLRILTEYCLMERGPVAPKSTVPGAISTVDIHLPRSEKIFLGEGKYEVQYKDRDAISATLQISSAHPLKEPEKILITETDDANEYLRRAKRSQIPLVTTSKPLVLGYS